MKKNNQLSKDALSALMKLRTVLVLGIFLLSFGAQSQSPFTINYQGILKDANGLAVNDTKFMEFRIYSVESGGSPFWTEQHTSVEIIDGLFSVVLGETNALLNFHIYPQYITFMVGGEEILPRQKFQSVPYSIKTIDAEYAEWADDAGYAYTAENSIKLNNISSDGFVQQDASENVTIAGTMTATAYQGDGSALTNLPPTPDSDWTENGNYVYNQSDSIGIGVANPEAKLHVAGHISQSGLGNSTFLGYEAGKNDDLSYNNNCFIGYQSGKYNDTGSNNAVVGAHAFTKNTSGSYNVACGRKALNENTTGSYNVANGSLALQYNTTGWFNTSTGNEALFANTTGHGNTANGYYALHSNTTGYSNIAIGVRSLFKNTDRSNLVAIGDSALYSNGQGASSSSHATNNTAIGSKALYSNTTGYNNTAIGNQSLYFNTTGYSNVAMGVSALKSNTDRSNLVAIGDFALYNNGIGVSSYYHATKNTAVGFKTLYSNTFGYGNTAIGYQSLYSNIGGYENTANGVGALKANTFGNLNTANGYEALNLNTSGHGNTASGSKTLANNTGGQWNTALGYLALNLNTASENTATGSNSLNSNTTGAGNTSNGFKALYSNTEGQFNTGVGYEALYSNIDGYDNASFGISSLHDNTDGNGNSSFGSYSLGSNTTGSYNTAIGRFAYYVYGGYTTYDNSTALGFNASISASNQVRLGSSYVTSIGGYTSWSNLSDGRFKQNVQENVPGLDFILKLKPVTYNLDVDKLNDFLHVPDSIQTISKLRTYADEKSNIQYTGFIAQEVEKTANDLGFDFSGIDKPQNEESHYSLRYAEFVVPLVKAVQEQQAIIEQQQELIDQLFELVQKQN